MKIEVREDYTIQLEELFNGIVIKTTDGVEFHICQRDYGIEVYCDESIVTFASSPSSLFIHHKAQIVEPFKTKER